MQDEIVTIYNICDDYLKDEGFRDDWQAEISAAEMMCIALVAARFFKNCLEHSRVFMQEEGYITTRISESRLNVREYISFGYEMNRSQGVKIMKQPFERNFNRVEIECLLNHKDISLPIPYPSESTSQSALHWRSSQAVSDF